MFDNIATGLNIWDIGAIILLVLTAIGFVWHIHNQRKRKKDFEGRLADRLGEKSTQDTHNTTV